MSRLKTTYENEIISKLMSKLSLKNKHEVLKCKKVLDNVKFKNKKIFHVEIISKNKIFYKTNFIKKVLPNDVIILGNNKIK